MIPTLTLEEINKLCKYSNNKIVCIMVALYSDNSSKEMIAQ